MEISQLVVVFYYFYLAIISLAAIGLVVVGFPRRVKESFPDNYKPRVLVMVPCRGVDYALERNLRSILAQDYPEYDVIAIVDSEDDPSVEVLDRLSIRRVVSSFKCTLCSGKTKALSTAISENPEYEAYVICDSDVRASKVWLKQLVAPLGNKEIGLSTTFPFFNPVGGFWSRIKAVWGIVGQGLMESSLTRFGWGGSLGFRKDLIDKDSLAVFSESVSDDTALTAICKSKGLSIGYSKDAQPVIDSPDDFKTFFEWSNRQTALSISASRRVYQYGILIYTASIVVFLSALILTIFDSAFFSLLFIPMLLSEVNNFRRSRIVFPSMFLITLILPFLFLANLVIAGRMDEIVWRGRRYTLQKESQNEKNSLNAKEND